MNGADTTKGLDALQTGHLRHFDNLSRRQPNDWFLMKGRAHGQEDFGAYRFQLAYMVYALALTHVHRLPAAPGVFKPIFERLIDKMLLPEVWMYWRDVSRGGSIFNAHLASGYHEEWDPVVRDNIMYSAYVQSMALLYNYLFGDDRYAKSGALTFEYWSYFWGGAQRRFAYDQNSLNEHIYWQMVENGYLGIACEPNCVFQICNQPAILGFRLHDLINGGDRASEVTRGYEQAWSEFGRIGENGHYHIMMSEDSKTIRPNLGKTPWVDAWCGSLMNMWNRDFVREHYPFQVRDLVVPGEDGALSVNSRPPPDAMGQPVVVDDPGFGWVAAWASEMGDSQTLNGLLAHADRHMQPTWLDGGLYYPRNDRREDDRGRRTLLEPMTGNVLLGYARLNVDDGLWRLYNEPWDRSHHTQPSLGRVASDIDVSRAVFDPEKQALHFTLHRRTDRKDHGEVLLDNVLGRGSWVLSRDGAVICSGDGLSMPEALDGDVRAEEDGIAVRCPSGGAHHFVMKFVSPPESSRNGR